MIYIKLFWSFFQIGLFSIGGGYVAMPLIQNQVVELNSWLTITEFIDIVTIAEMTPGPIAINASTFVGMRVAGFSGAVVATVACIIPSCIIVLSLAYFYYKYKKLTLIQSIIDSLRPAVVAMITSAGLGILLLAFFNKNSMPINFDDTNMIAVGIFMVNIFLLRKYKVDPIYIMVGSGVFGAVIYHFT